MTESTKEADLKKLALHAEHQAAGGHFGVFGDWYVPLYFTSVLDEHETVRTGVGVFDISHMGEFYVEGAGARSAIDRWITNDVSKLYPGRALYSPVCNARGGIVDDVIVYELSAEQYLIVVNAGNIEKDFSWFQKHAHGTAKLRNASSETALLAVQGPKSPDVIRALFDVDLSKLSYYHFTKLNSPFGELLLAQTGYTGETGFELLCAYDQAAPLWKRLFERGKPFGLKPIGFGARDTLRLEARYLLYGRDMTTKTSPLEAGLGWTIGWDKPDFIGKKALFKEREAGVQRRLVGFELKDRGIAREGAKIFANGREVGQVTSGTFSPTLKKSIGLGYVSQKRTRVGQALALDIRSRLVPAEVVKTPFYSGRDKDTKKSKNREA